MYNVRVMAANQSGWNRPSTSHPIKKGGEKSSSLLCALIVGVICVVAALGVCYFLRNDTPAAGKTSKEERKAIRSTNHAPVASVKPLETVVARKKPKKDDADTVKPETKKAVQSELDKLLKSVVADFRVDPSKMKAIFTNDVMCQLQMYVKPGEDMPPPDPVSDEEARAAIKEGVYIKLDDSPEVQETKKFVHEMLGLLKKWMDDGGSADSFFSELEHEQTMASEAMETVRNEVEELHDAGDVEGAKDTAKVLNKFLEEKGLPNVVVKGVNGSRDIVHDESEKVSQTDNAFQKEEE